MMICPRCGRENEPENQFCGRCGLELATVAAPQVAEDAVPCAKHPRELTTLKCGKCEKPICHKCVVMSPAGTRCSDCSKSNIAFRPEAVVHEAKLGVRNILRMGPWGIWIWILIGSFVFGAIRQCSERQQEPTVIETTGGSVEGSE